MLLWIVLCLAFVPAICQPAQFVQEASVGGGGGSAFDDWNDGLHGEIREICTRSGSDWLQSLAVTHAGYAKKTHGEMEPRRRSWFSRRRRRYLTEECLRLQPGEHITSAKVTVNDRSVQWIDFGLNTGRNSHTLHGRRRTKYCGGRRRRRRRAGCDRRREWVATMNAPQEPHAQQLVAFHGRTGALVDRIGVYWGEGNRRLETNESIIFP